MKSFSHSHLPTSLKTMMEMKTAKKKETIMVIFQHSLKNFCIKKNYMLFFTVPVARAMPSRGRRRSKGVPMGTQTKHDADVCGRRNVRNMEKVREIVNG